MDRNREARRASNMAAPPNGLSSRRRHRSTSLRDSPVLDEDGGGIEIQEPGRLRDRGVVVKKDRGGDRDRERERSSRSKRRRENRMINHHQHHHLTGGSNRDDGDDTSEESVNDEEGEDEDDAGNGGALRMLPPPPSNPSTAAAAAMSTNHNNNINININNNHHHPQQQQQQQLHHRKSFPPSANKVFRTVTAAPPPAWKAADEMIGVSVPRKARSASTKRSHEWISGGAVVGGGGGGGPEQINRQSSTSPVRLAASPALVAPPSPSSSNISVRKKMKANGGGSKPRLPKSSSKSSSSNPEELEIEIAEVLYGLMTQSQAPSKKEDSTTKLDSNKSSSDNKSRVSSPISNSTAPLQNSTSLSTVAPKRKRPRQVSENLFSRNSPVSPSIKNEIDHQHHQSPKTDISTPYLENNSQVSAAAGENCISFGLTSLPVPSSDPLLQKAEEDGKCGVGVVLTEEEVEKKSHAVELNDGNKITETVITTAASMTTTNLKAANSETAIQKEEKFEIDLMAPPPQQRTSPERDEYIAFSDHKQMATQKTSKNKEEEKLMKSGKEETMNLTEEQKKSKTGTAQETGESSSKQVMNEDRNIGLHIDLEQPNKDSTNIVSGSSNRSLHQVLKHQQSAKSETHTEKNAQPSSMQMPMSVGNWPAMGYVAPLTGVISMDGNTMPSAPIQPIFTHPRPKRCATHCYIARNIHYLQQFMKINPFWPAASGSAPMFGGAKPCSLNVTPSPELHGNIPQSMGHGVNIFPGHTAIGKDSKSSQASTIPDSAQRKQVLLQQVLPPPVTPNNILHGPAFIIPFNQQQAVAASASVRPGPSKLNNNNNNTSTATVGSGGSGGSGSGSGNSGTVGASATAAASSALSFNYPNMSANETQYLAILQNNPYTFPIPAVGAPPNYRGNPHGQSMPLFNGSFYSSQMIHPSQIPQPPQQAPQSQSQNHHHPSQFQQISQTHQNSSGSTSSSQKHLQTQQQRQQGSGVAVNGGGSLHNNNNGSYPVPHKSRSQPSQHMNPPQARHLENDVTRGEDSPSTADSRVSRAANTMGVYGHNFAMPIHSQNFALMNNPQAAAPMSNATTAGGNSNDKKHQLQQSQQQGSKRGGGGGVESASSLPPQTFAMSFAPMNGTTCAVSSMAQNHAIIQSLPESLRQNYHHMMTAPPPPPHHSQQQKKDFRVTEEASRTVVVNHHDSSNADEDRKGSSKSGQQSIAFSRPDLPADASGGTCVIDSSSRNINLGSGSNNNRSSRSPILTSVAAAAQSSHHHLHAQFQQQQQQQQVLQLQKQQQQQNQNMNARSKNPTSNNGSAYPDHHLSSSMAAAKFPNSLSSLPQNLVQTSTSPGQSSQWRNSVRGGGPTTSQVPSSSATTSSLKNLHQAQQQQSTRPHPQSHNTHISFGTAPQKLQSTTSLQMQQQQQNQNPGSNSSNQSPSPPMLIGSPTTSSISKGGGGGGGSPRTNAGSASTSGRAGQSSSLSSSQQAKNSPVGTQRSSPSILGNPPHNSNSSSKSQQLPKQTLQQQAQAQAQAHMFCTHPYMQVQQPQAQQHSGGATTTAGYYLPRKQQLQQSSQPPSSSSSSSSTAMLSLCPPVTLANTTTTSDPAKAIAAATSNLKGGVGQGILHAAQYGGATQSSMPGGFPQYAHNAPASVQVKPTEQKQPAGE